MSLKLNGKVPEHRALVASVLLQRGAVRATVEEADFAPHLVTTESHGLEIALEEAEGTLWGCLPFHLPNRKLSFRPLFIEL